MCLCSLGSTAGALCKLSKDAHQGLSAWLAFDMSVARFCHMKGCSIFYSRIADYSDCHLQCPSYLLSVQTMP